MEPQTPALGSARWPRGRPASARARARRQPARRPGYSMRSLAVSESPHRSRLSRATAPACSSPLPTVGRVAGDSSARRRHRRAPAVVRHVRRPVAGGPHVAWSASARRHRRSGSGSRVSRGHRSQGGSVLGGPRRQPPGCCLHRQPGPSLRVVDILRTDEGIVSGAGRAQVFFAGGPGLRADRRHRLARPGDPGRAEPVAQETSEVTFISADGSPTPPDARRRERVPRGGAGDGRRPRSPACRCS